ncbi:hypothetical protein HHK36_025083 [Tetracentron sinense]|uniref:CCT domain-containing protein n=1 Tax=Tetracentron sinense TaxID=13715 RepID=A0A835D5A0_TETSI|nr:hypothetical protein HHK36_025083 [Tetracentron sinense]
MCMKNPRSDLRNRYMTDSKTTLSPKPARKTRTKTRKPKFLSLRQELSPGNTQESGEMTQHHQLNLFPLYPENLYEEKEIHDDNVAHFFDVDGAATLNGLLGGERGGGGVMSSEEDSLSPSLTYPYGEHDSHKGESSLARTALRHKERDASEEVKWVSYSDVVEKKEEEVSSCAADVPDLKETQGLLLKLDYQEILNVWSNKAPLYIEGECPQTVPDVLDDSLAHDSTNVLIDVGCTGNGRLWRVPDEGSSVIEDMGEEGRKMGQREARVLRYKEKRQNRLFSKRIRYEVRKLNAEKRPRMKGRFVKRS